MIEVFDSYALHLLRWLLYSDSGARIRVAPNLLITHWPILLRHFKHHVGFGPLTRSTSLHCAQAMFFNLSARAFVRKRAHEIVKLLLERKLLPRILSWIILGY